MHEQDSGIARPVFRDGVSIHLEAAQVTLSMDRRACSFEFGSDQRMAVESLLESLRLGGKTCAELLRQTPQIAGEIPDLLANFDQLRLLTESASLPAAIVSGAQLYREVRRVRDRTVARVAKSLFQDALAGGRATKDQLIGYALEYFWLVREAPGLIGPALASAQTQSERALLQTFLASELGHDRYLRDALSAVGVGDDVLSAHTPLPATFSLGASLGVYSRQHAVSFKACLFLFEEGNGEFIDAFDNCCMKLGLPQAFYEPLRRHAGLNDEFDHGDISRLLLQELPIVDPETSAIVKQNVSVLIETLVQQEEQIMAHYGAPNVRLPRSSV